MKSRSGLLAVFLLLSVGSSFGAVPDLGNIKVYVSRMEDKSSGGGGASFEAPLLTATINRFKAQGFSVLPPSDKSAGQSAPYEVSGYFVLENKNLIFQISVLHRATGRLIAGDMASVFAGLTSLDLLNDSLDAVAQKTADYAKKAMANRATAIPLPEPLIFHSQDEGAMVFWGGGDEVGKIKQGKVQAPYFPFPSDGTLVVKVSKDGYQTRNTVFALTADTRDVELPPLVRKIDQEAVFNTALGRLLGVGSAYHYYLIPNQVFLGLEDHLYLQYSFKPGARPVFHNDTWTTLGAYLFTPPEWDFRFAFEAGFGALQTPLSTASATNFYLDYAILPVGLIFEYRLYDVPLQLGLRFPYALGGTGLLSRGWLMIQDSLPQISLGAAWRW